jgi:hypothetical protein
MVKAVKVSTSTHLALTEFSVLLPIIADIKAIAGGGGFLQSKLEDERRGLQEKIIGLLESDPSLYKTLKEPAIAALAQGLRPGEVQRAPPGPEKLFYRGSEQTAPGLGKPMQRTDLLDKPSYGGGVQRFGSGTSLLGEPYGAVGSALGDPYGTVASLLGDPPSRVGSAPQGMPREDTSAGQEFKNLQGKIFDIFQGRDTKPSAAPAAPASYGQANEEYADLSSNEFKQQRMGYPGDAPRASDRGGLLGNPFDASPANGRMDYQSAGQFASKPPQQPSGAPQFGIGSFNKPPPGFGGQPAAGFRDASFPPPRQGQGAPQAQQPDWMQAPPQRFSRFS